MHLHTTYQDVFLWRGQTNTAWGLTPGMHSRVTGSTQPPTEATASRATAHLLRTARAVGVHEYNGAKLPDLALLAHLQHYGAATPLLDVSTDPLIASWMAAFKSPESPGDGDDVSGALFGIVKPDDSHWVKPLDSRQWDDSSLSISSNLNGDVWWLPLVTDQAGEKNWVEERITSRGKPGAPARRTTDVFKLEIPAAAKQFIRKMLIERSGLTVAAIYPVPWHRPYIEEFSRSYDRTRPLGLDL
jgi:hypothetical protein